jgi:hypothetical protein
MPDKEPSDWSRTWDARVEALARIFGPADDQLFHAVLPFQFGGTADVVCFRPAFLDGTVYVTSELTGRDCYRPYELAIITPRDEAWAAPLISNLAPYVVNEADLMPGETMETGDFIGGASSPIKAMVITKAPTRGVAFSFDGREFDIHLCVGITSAELAFRMQQGSEALLKLLDSKGVLPFTDTQRLSVV